MDRKFSWQVLSVVVLLALPRCSMGGIVDNGDKPTPQGRSNSGLTISGILGAYEVFVPDTEWSLAAGATDDSASIFNSAEKIEFSRADSKLLDTCLGARQRNEAGIILIDCDGTHSAFLLGGGDVVEAKYNAKTAAVASILQSFRKT